jgi:hypothetical protein
LSSEIKDVVGTEVLTGLLEKNFVRLASEEFIPLLRELAGRELGIGE